MLAFRFLSRHTLVLDEMCRSRQSRSLQLVGDSSGQADGNMRPKRRREGK